LIIVFYFPLQGIASYSRKFTEPDTRALARQVISEHLQPDGVVVTGPFRINFPTESRVLTIPYNAQEPERYAAFHDLRWYRDLDFIIVSNPDGNKPDSGRFRDYLAFYNSLKAQATLIDSIALTEYNNGPSLWIYRLPSDTIDAPFDSTLIEKLQSAENGWETANFIDDLGMFLAGKGKYQKGEQALQYAVEHNSGLVIACQHLGTLQMRLGKYQEAADNFSGYLKQNPRDALMQCALGDAMYELNRLDEAEKGYLASIAIDGAYEDAYRGLVRVYTDKHDNASMIKVLERYLTYLPPTNQNAKMIRQKVEEMKQEANK
jgi:tetratricopeptide (TPR) repeat protein